MTLYWFGTISILIFIFLFSFLLQICQLFNHLFYWTFHYFTYNQHRLCNLNEDLAISWIDLLRRYCSYSLIMVNPMNDRQCWSRMELDQANRVHLFTFRQHDDLGHVLLLWFFLLKYYWQLLGPSKYKISFLKNKLIYKI